MFDIHFLRPEYLTALLIAVPLTVGMWYLNFRGRKTARQEFGDERLIGRYTKPLSLRGELIIATSWVLAVAMVILAMAGPMSESLPTTAKSGSLQVVAVVDVSKSMGAEDYRSVMPSKDGYAPENVPGRYGSRLDYVHGILTQKVMPAIIGNQLGVVLYSGEAFEQVTLTDDWSATTWVLDNWMTIGNAPGGGSDYGSGIDKALQMLERDKVDGLQPVIVLFTDGGFSGESDELDKTLEKVNDFGARLIIIGVGGRTPLPIKIYDKDNNVTGVETRDNAPVKTAIDEAAVVALASRASADYVILDPTSNGELNINWASTLGGSKTETQDKPVFQYPLGIALIFLTGLFLRGLVTRKQVI